MKVRWMYACFIFYSLQMSELHHYNIQGLTLVYASCCTTHCSVPIQIVYKHITFCHNEWCRIPYDRAWRLNLLSSASGWTGPFKIQAADYVVVEQSITEASCWELRTLKWLKRIIPSGVPERYQGIIPREEKNLLALWHKFFRNPKQSNNLSRIRLK